RKGGFGSGCSKRPRWPSLTYSKKTGSENATTISSRRRGLTPGEGDRGTDGGAHQQRLGARERHPRELTLDTEAVRLEQRGVGRRPQHVDDHLDAVHDFRRPAEEQGEDRVV